MVKYLIDQSGKIEQTERQTVIGRKKATLTVNAKEVIKIILGIKKIGTA